MIQIAVSGICGKTGGELIASTEKNKNFKIVFGVDGKGVSNGDIPVYKSFAEAESAGKSCDGIIDFSSPSALADILAFAKKHKVFAVFATTGYDEDDKKEIEKASLIIPVCVTENASRGIAAIKEILPALHFALKDYPITITEIHNKNKKDAPSGTAIALNALLLGEGKITSIREGDVKGIHTIVFSNGEEEVSVTHKAFLRGIFADGALKIAENLYKKSAGLYNARGEKI